MEKSVIKEAIIEGMQQVNSMDAPHVLNLSFSKITNGYLACYPSAGPDYLGHWVQRYFETAEQAIQWLKQILEEEIK